MPELPRAIALSARDFAKAQRQAGVDLQDDWLNNGPMQLGEVLPSGWRERSERIFDGQALVLGRSDLLKSKLFALCDRGTDLPDCIALAPTAEAASAALRRDVLVLDHPGSRWDRISRVSVAAGCSTHDARLRWPSPGDDPQRAPRLRRRTLVTHVVHASEGRPKRSCDASRVQDVRSVASPLEGRGTAPQRLMRASRSLAPIFVVALAGCFGWNDTPMQCCDDECDYFVNYAPTVSVPITFDGMTFNTTKEGDCLAGTRKAYYCGDYWGYAGSSQSCKLDAYWGSSDGEGATIEAVKISEAAQTVTARVTVTIPGTGVWAKPAVLSIVGPRDARDEGLYGMTNHEELIVYPGGIMFSHAVERTVGRRENILFGLLRTEDERVGYKIGTTQSREVKLNRPRVSTALGGAL